MTELEKHRETWQDKTESQTDKTPYEVLEQITKLKDEMYCA